MKKTYKITIYIIFGVYLLVLIKLILFKYPLHMINDMLVNNDLELLRRRLYVSNYLPFKTIWNYSKNIGWGVSQVNVIGNIIAFVPLGFLTPLILEKRSIKKISLVGAGISLAFEIIQLATGIGSFDVDDLILNTFGTILGYIILKLLTRFLKIEQIGL